MRRTLLLLAALFTAGCGADFYAFESVQNTNNPHTSFVIVWLSDSPIDGADAFEVTIDRVDLVRSGGDVELEDAHQTYDLFALRNGSRAMIAEAAVPTGGYDAVRLTLRATGPLGPRTRTGGVWESLVFAPGTLHVVDVPFALNAQQGGRSEIQIDFNARLSVLDVGGALQLDPVLDAVNPRLAGEITGTVLDPAGQPIAGAIVVVKVGGVEYRSTTTMIDGSYVLTPLPPGAYDVEIVNPGGPFVGAPGILVTTGDTTNVPFVVP